MSGMIMDNMLCIKENIFDRSGRRMGAAAAVTIAVALAPESATAQINNFYVSVDSRQEIHFGTYLGEPNPNQNRLTFLYAHQFEDITSNHFHGIGVHFYEGDIPDHTPTTTNGNNRIPETFTGQDPLTLAAGDGLYAGKLISTASDEHYSDLTLYSVHDLSGFAPDAAETFMYNSGAMGYQTPMTGLNLAIELVSMTPGLHVGGSEAFMSLSSPGEQLPIGGEGDLPFLPVFWVDSDAPLGTYSAEFQLVDLSGTFMDSGTINFDFAVVPEPATLGMVMGLGVFLSGRRRILC